MKRLALGVAALALFLAEGGQVEADLIGHIDAGYLADTTSLSIFNTSAMDLTNVVITASAGPEASSSEFLGTIAAGGSVAVPFQDGSGSAFAADFDDTNGFSNTFASQTYTVTAQGGITSGPFSPASNLTGTFLDFLGTGADNDVAPLTVANLSTPSAVPEPASLTLAGTGVLGALGMLWRKRKKTASRAVC